MKKIIVLFAISALSFFGSSASAQKEFSVRGVMMHTELEGGCWYLQAGHKKYELVGSEDQMRTVHVEGRMVALNVKQATMIQSVCMIGPMLRIIDIYDTVSHPHNPPITRMQISGRIAKTDDDCWYVRTKNGKRYELQDPIPKRYLHKGARYNRYSLVIPKVDGECNLDAVIIEVGKTVKPLPKAKAIYNDPR